MYGVFTVWTETSVHLARLDFCCDYIKQSQPELKLSNNLKRRHIALNLVVSCLDNNMFFNAKDIQTRLIPFAIPWSFSPTSKRWTKILAQLFRLRFFI